VEGLQTLKPWRQKAISMPENGIKEVVETSRGINLEVCMVASDKKSLRMRWPSVLWKT